MSNETGEFIIWDGSYEKKAYLARINGKLIPCWPNAGLMCACDKSGRTWKPESNIEVRICTYEEHIEAGRKLK